MQKRKKIIYLTGFMGSGKSTVGAMLARELGWPFIDLDQTIEAGQGMTIRKIFETEGELHFRWLEHAALRELVKSEPAVIALGGGTVVQAGQPSVASGDERNNHLAFLLPGETICPLCRYGGPSAFPGCGGFSAAATGKSPRVSKGGVPGHNRRGSSSTGGRIHPSSSHFLTPGRDPNRKRPVGPADDFIAQKINCLQTSANPTSICCWPL